MLQKTNTKTTAPSLKSVWRIVFKLFAETRHSVLLHKHVFYRRDLFLFSVISYYGLCVTQVPKTKNATEPNIFENSPYL